MFNTSNFYIFSKIIKTVEKVTKKRKLDDKMLNEIEDLLISSDIGVSTASLIVEKIKKENFSKELDIKQLKQLISDEIFENQRGSVEHLAFCRS